MRPVRSWSGAPCLGSSCGTSACLKSRRSPFDSEPRHKGLVVQWEDAAMASPRSGFDSPPVHRAGVAQRESTGPTRRRRWFDPIRLYGVVVLTGARGVRNAQVRVRSPATPPWGCSSTGEQRPCKPKTRVRFPSPPLRRHRSTVGHALGKRVIWVQLPVTAPTSS